MKVDYSGDFISKLKKADVRIRKNFREKIAIFQENPDESSLNNHQLRYPYQGLQSIDITNDYRAIYEEITVGKSTVAYFVILGTHDELYGKDKNLSES